MVLPRILHALEVCKGAPVTTLDSMLGFIAKLFAACRDQDLGIASRLCVTFVIVIMSNDYVVLLGFLVEKDSIPLIFELLNRFDGEDSKALLLFVYSN